MGAVHTEREVSLVNTGTSTLRQRDCAQWDITMTLTLQLPLSGISVWRQPAQQAAVQLNMPFTEHWRYIFYNILQADMGNGK